MPTMTELIVDREYWIAEWHREQSRYLKTRLSCDDEAMAMASRFVTHYDKLLEARADDDLNVRKADGI